MAFDLKQPSMSAGEVSPSLYARTDLDFYRTGLAKCENFFVGYQGGAKRRSGFRYIGDAKFNTETVLIPFQFSTVQTYVLEVGNKYIRFIANGAYVTDDNGDKVEVTTEFLSLDVSRITYTQSADVLTLFHKSYPTVEVRRTSSNSFDFTVFKNNLGPFESLNTDESVEVWASASSGVVTLESTADLFTDNYVDELIYLDQSTSGLVSTWIQRMAVSVGTKVYYAGNYYECTRADRYDGNAAQTGDTPPTHIEGEQWDGPNQVLPDDNRDARIGVNWRYLHSGFGIARVDSVQSAKQATATVIKTIPETIVGGTVPAANWSFADETTRTNYPLTSPSPGSTLAVDFSVEITETGGGRTVALSYPADWVIDFATGTVTLTAAPSSHFPNADGVDSSSGTVLVNQKNVIRQTHKWGFEPWRVDSGYPQCGTYYQQRLTMASSADLPQTIWLSVTDSFNNFQKSRPTLADDSMRFDVNSLQVNEIYNLAPLNALLAFTSGGVWSLNQGSNDVITPENPPSVRIQSYDGAAPIKPIITGSTGLYVQDGGQIVRDIGFDFSNDAFVGTDLTVRSAHLFENREVVSWAYAKNPDKLIWVVFSDGEMAAFTYLREQSVWGWAPCVTDGKVLSVATIREGRADVLYAVINRDGNNQIERMDEWFHSDQRDNFFVDSGLTYDGRGDGVTTMTINASKFEYPEQCTLSCSSAYFTSEMEGRAVIFGDSESKCWVTISAVNSPTSATAVIQVIIPEELHNTPATVWGLGATKLSGLDHLEGKTVSVYSDGSDGGDHVVVNGAIEVQSPGVVISAGLPYTSTLQTLDVELAQQPSTSQAKRNVINKVFAYVRNTMSIKGGTEIDSLYDMESRYGEDYNTPPTQRSNLIEINCDGRWNRQGRVILSQDRPVTTEITSIIPRITQSAL